MPGTIQNREALPTPPPDEVREVRARRDAFVRLGHSEQRALALADLAEDERQLSSVARHVIFEDGRWVIFAEDGAEPSHVFGHYHDALRRAAELARGSGGAVFIHGAGGGLVDRIDYSDGEPHGIDDGELHVAKGAAGGWMLHRTGERPVHEEFPSKPDALRHGRERAAAENAVLVVHGAGGLEQRRGRMEP